MTTELKPCPACQNSSLNRLICWTKHPRDEEKTVRCMNCLCEAPLSAWNTRAVPDVPELVRYDLFTHKPMEPSTDGEYVLYDQAAAIIAAEKSIRKQTQERLEQSESELKALRTKLDQINDQKPAAYTLIFRKAYGVNAETTFKTFEDAEKYAVRCELPLSSVIPLYAAPVASEPTAKQALQIIADLPTPMNEDIMTGHEDAYRAVEALFVSPPDISCNPVASESETIERLRKALQSISSNTCCVGCREASLVASAALEESKP